MKLSRLCLALFVLTAACKQNREIKVYRVAKDEGGGMQASSPANQGMMPGTPGADPHAGLDPSQLGGSAGSGQPRISDTPPPDWKKQPLSTMRQASYLVEGADGAATDISLVILRGAAGGTLANVNRWLGQLGQPPVDEAGLKNISQSITTPLGTGVLVDITGLASGADPKKDGRMIGVILDKDGDGWFFKMRGNDALTAAEKDHFLAWVKSVSTGAAAPAPANSIPKPPAAEAGAVTWQVPAGWTLSATASSMRYATFEVTGPNGTKGEVAISHFPGDVGGDLMNVNRWRGQVGLQPIDAAAMAAEISHVKAGSDTFSLVDLTGTQTSMAAGWTRHGPDTWFFKLTGPEALVSAEKTKFTSFLESVRFNTP